MLVAEMLGGSLKVRCAAKLRALHCTELSERRRCSGGLNDLFIQIERLFQIERHECSRTLYESDFPLRTGARPSHKPEFVSYVRLIARSDTHQGRACVLLQEV